MKIIETKVFNNETDRLIDYSFAVASDGLYTIKITASAKAWWQHIVSPRLFLKKDSLAVRLDGEDSVPIVTKKKLNSDDMWNGNVLKGHEMTLYIHASLKRGNHVLSFIPQGKPFLGEISIFQITDNTFSLANLTPSSRDRIPWLTFLFHQTVTVSSLSITARAEKRKGDDGDIQIRLDGIIEKNETPRAHRDWFWCGKILKGDVRTFIRSFPREKAPKRIDVIIDESPTIVHFLATIASDPFHRMPTVDDPRWTGNFRDDSDQMILARAIFGEGRSLPEIGRIAIGWVIRNRIGYTQWGNTYHDVILRPRHFSAFNKDDQNRMFVEDPSRDSTQIKAWQECYETAGSIIKGTAPDPTTGANHYYSTFIKTPYWAKGAEQTLKVDNTLFYRVSQKGKRILLPLFFLVLFSAGIVAFAADFTNTKHRRAISRWDGHFSEYIGDGAIAVYYGCGTECEGVRVFDERTGSQKAEFNYGVGYIWSPDKRYVVAFHSSAGHGFTVGDRKGKELFTYTKPLEKTFDIPSVFQWTPNSSKLAVLVHDDEAHYDLFVVWGFDERTRVTSMHVPSAQNYTIDWDTTGRIVYVNGSAVLEIDESGYGHHLLLE